MITLKAKWIWSMLQDLLNRKSHNISNSEDFSFLRLTLDEKDDLKVIRNVFEEFKPNIF